MNRLQLSNDPEQVLKSGIAIANSIRRPPVDANRNKSIKWKKKPEELVIKNSKKSPKLWSIEQDIEMQLFKIKQAIKINLNLN